MNDLEISDDIVKTQVLLLKTSDLIFRYSETRLSKLGITSTQHAVLMTLSVFDSPPTLTELSKRLLRAKNGMTTVIDNMEKAGLVKRKPDENDRRTIKIMPTEKGIALLESSRAASKQLVYNAMSCLDQQELGQLTALLKKIRKHLSQEDQSS